MAAPNADRNGMVSDRGIELNERGFSRGNGCSCSSNLCADRCRYAGNVAAAESEVAPAPQFPSSVGVRVLQQQPQQQGAAEGGGGGGGGGGGSSPPPDAAPGGDIADPESDAPEDDIVFRDAATKLLSERKHNFDDTSHEDLVSLLKTRGMLEACRQYLDPNNNPSTQSASQFFSPVDNTYETTMNVVYVHEHRRTYDQYDALSRDESVDRGLRGAIKKLLSRNVGCKGLLTVLYLKYVGETKFTAELRKEQHEEGGGAPLFFSALNTKDLGAPDASGVLSAVGDGDTDTRKLLEAVWAGLLGVSVTDGTGLNIVKCGKWASDGHLRDRMQKLENEFSTPNPEGRGARMWAKELTILSTGDIDAMRYGEVYGLTYVSEILYTIRSHGGQKGGKFTNKDLFDLFVARTTKELLEENPEMSEEVAEAKAKLLGVEGGHDSKKSRGGQKGGFAARGRIIEPKGKRKAPVRVRKRNGMADKAYNAKRCGEGAAKLQCRTCGVNLGLWMSKMRSFDNFVPGRNPMKKHLENSAKCRQTPGEKRDEVALNFKHSIWDEDGGGVDA